MKIILLLFYFAVIYCVKGIKYYHHPLIKYMNYGRYTYLQSPKISSTNDAELLYLTPYIENGDIAGAQRAARIIQSKAPNITSYGGYLTINKKYNSNVYFRYFVAENNPETAPLISLNQGGPGYSLENSILDGTGPYILASDISYIFQDCRWMKAAHVVYFDYPFSAGYSFLNDSSGYPRSKEQYGQDLYSALIQFYALFPNLLKHDYYAFGRGYAAKFVTVLAKYIDIHNTQNSDFPLNLRGLILESAYVDPITAFNHSTHFYKLGLLDKSGRTKFENMEAQCHSLIDQQQYEKATDVCLSIVDNIANHSTLFKQLTGFNSLFDLEETSVNETELQRISEKVTSLETRKILKVGSTTFTPDATNIYRKYLKSDYTQSILPLLSDVITKYRVLFVNGMENLMFLYPLTEMAIDKMKFAGKESFDRAQRKILMIDNEIAGYVKSSERLTHAMIRNAGYNIASRQRCWSYQLTNLFIQNKI